MIDKKMDVEVNNGYKSFNVDNLMNSGLINLMRDYNLTWEAVYNIIQEAINNASSDCLDCKNLIRSYDDHSEIADIHCRKNGELIQNGMCGYCKYYEEVQE